MTIDAINSKAYRKISLKAENICKAKKKNSWAEKNYEKALNENNSQEHLV